MRSLTYYVGATLDGYIAGPQGEADHFPVSEDHVGHMTTAYPEVLPTHVRRALGVDDRPNQRFDTVIMGRGTYEPALALDVTDPYAHLRTYVATSDPELTRGDAAVTAVADPLACVRALKAEDSELGIWLAGGGRLAGALADEIDEIVLKLYPVLSATGVPTVSGAFSPAAFTLVDRVGFDSGCTVLTFTRA